VSWKKRKGLYLSLIFVILAGLFTWNAYGHIKTASASSQAVVNLDSLTLTNVCFDCHESNLPDTYWYCHNALPAESYASRMYLGVHLDWLTPDMKVPAGLFMPLKDELPAGKAEIHVFNRNLYPSTVTITPGTVVTWTNLDIRDVTLTGLVSAYKNPFTSVTLKTEESVSFTFADAGTFTYTITYPEFRPSETSVNQVVYGKIIVAAPK
jgi:plastocyanin